MLFSVLWLHSIQYCSAEMFDFFDIGVYRLAQTVGMPLFMMIGGYLFWNSLQKRTFVEAVTLRTRQMLQPIVMVGTIIYLTVNLARTVLKHGPKAIADFAVTGIGVEHLTKFWFLWSILACSVVTAIVWKMVKKPAFRVPAFILGAFLLCLFPSTDKSISVYPFFVVGFVYHEHETVLREKLWKFRFVPVVVYPLLCVFLKREHCIDVSGIIASKNALECLDINLYRLVSGLFGCAFVIIITWLVYSKFNKGIVKKLLDFQIRLGEKSLQMYCLQVLVLERWFAEVYRKVVECLGIKLVNIKGLYSLVITPLVALAFAFLLLKVIEWLEKKNLSRYIFGR